MRILFILLMILIGNDSLAQDRNSVWVFGDSAGIDFSTGTPIAIPSSVISRGSCVSISETSGDLLFYAFTRAGIAGNSGRVFNKNHILMDNGDSLLGQGWYQELVIIPDPAADSSFYLFSIGVTNSSSPGLFYSKVVFSNNNINGIITQKNIQLQSFNMVDCINAVKHGNGRDWWVIFRENDYPGSNNEWCSYLITPNGIQNFSTQTIGEQNRTGGGHTTFSSEGDKLVFTNWSDLVELYDFDRCSGLLSNPITIEDDPGMPPFLITWSSEFSPDGSKLYVSSSEMITFLFQYDLNNPNVATTKDTLWTLLFPQYAGGGLKRAPDNKIYISTWYYDGFNTPYPYTDSVYNMYNMNLSVINQPDSLGSACDFQPFSFYLGGKRTYVGLPNNPDYEMSPLVGSPCDTLVGISEPQPTILIPQLHIYYHPEWQTAFINANNLTGTKGLLEIIDVQGKMVHREDIQIVNGYYTRNFNMTGMADGMYFVKLFNDGERLSGKLVKY